MLEPGQFVAEANGAIEQAARRHFHLEVMYPITEEQMLMAVRAPEDRRQTLEMVEVESIAIAATNR